MTTLAKKLCMALVVVSLVAVAGCTRQQTCPAVAAPPPCPACDCAVAVAPTQVQPTYTGPTTEEWMHIPARILFRTSGGELDEEARRVLQEMVATVRSRTDIVRVRIEGHTDSRGGEGENEALALERARSVAAYVISLGVPEHMLEPVGYGATRPITSDSSAIDREQNRRVEFSILVRRPVGAPVM